jgi:ribosomal protein L29
MKPIKVIVCLWPTNDLLSRIDEATTKTIGRYTARRDPPHFQGDEMHGHCKLPGGKEIAWTVTGKRRHPNKFPADSKIPQDAKAAIAALLGVDSNIFEAYETFDEVEQEVVFILERRKMTRSEIEQEIRNQNLSPEDIEKQIKELRPKILMLRQQGSVRAAEIAELEMRRSILSCLLSN